MPQMALLLWMYLFSLGSLFPLYCFSYKLFYHLIEALQLTSVKTDNNWKG